MKNKIEGMLLGLHVGDSLGANLEFSDPRDIDDLQTEIIGGGALNWSLGEATDDTLMMIMLLESLTLNNKKVDVSNISKRYVEWMISGPKDIGNTIRVALTKIEEGVSPFESGLKNESSQGNGSLMRCAPMAIINCSNEDIKNQCAITHAHQNCIASDIIFINSLRELLVGVDKNEVFNNALEKAKDLSSEIYEGLKKVPNMSWEEVRSVGFVIDSLSVAYWGLLATSSFEEALILIVNRGGDADTNGAICGALCGAYYGVEAIPKRWLEQIQEKKKIINKLNILLEPRG